jgi:hypothetical protein
MAGYNAPQLQLETGDSGSFNFNSAYAVTDNGISNALNPSASGPSTTYSTKYYYKIYLLASGSADLSWTADGTAQTATLDFLNPDQWEMSYCSETPNVVFNAVGSCELGEGCFTTVNIKAYTYAYETMSASSVTDCSDASADGAWAINRGTSMTEAYGLSNCDMNGDSCIGFVDGSWGASTFITRTASETGLKLYHDVSGPSTSVGSIYQMCYSSQPTMLQGAVPTGTSSSMNLNLTASCDLGCSPNEDCTLNDFPGFISGDSYVNSDSFYATVAIVTNAGLSEHQVAFAFGHPPDAAASLVPGLAIFAAALATMM